ncbi:hypothetical protein B0H14DRAFT_3884603 [Mycena olivaceomarginata]|nr:hypothetical protein B0H14DRAFT_3884603 [Mycena olivaceomarginata]
MSVLPSLPIPLCWSPGINFEFVHGTTYPNIGNIDHFPIADAGVLSAVATVLEARTSPWKSRAPLRPRPSQPPSAPTWQTPSTPFAHAVHDHVTAAALFRPTRPRPGAPPYARACTPSPRRSLPNTCVRSAHVSPVSAPLPALNAGVDDSAHASAT